VNWIEVLEVLCMCCRYIRVCSESQD